MDDITLIIVFLAFMNALLFMSGMLSGSIVLVILAILGIPGMIGMIIDGRENKRIERHNNTLRNIAVMEHTLMPDALTHWDDEATEAYRLELKKAKVADLNCPNCNHYIYDDKGYCIKCNYRSDYYDTRIPDKVKVTKKATQSALDAAEAKYVANQNARAYVNREHFDH